MRKSPSNKLIGLFILCGVALFIATVFMLFSDRLVKKDDKMVVMYFTESIQGLDVGSPVMLKGVTLGKVSKIGVITDLENLDFSIPVYVALNDEKLAVRRSKKAGHQVLQELVKKGLRARLGSLNLLTGQAMIELEFVAADEEPVYRGRKDSHIPEIPTVLSQYEEISRGLQELPLRETLKKFNDFMEYLNREVIPGAKKVINEFAIIPERTDGVPSAVNSFNKAMQSVSSAAKSLGNFADYIERHPESLLRGKGGF